MSKSKSVVPASFKIGDLVTWKSQAAGSWKTKIGTVIEVVPPRCVARSVHNTSTRLHESYVVEVTHEPKRSTSAIKSVRVKKPERYWPVVSNLRYATQRVGKKTAPAVQDYDAPQTKFEDLKTDHLPVQSFPSDPDMQWKDVARDTESAN